MFTPAFWKATAERMVKTFCQVLAALLVVDSTDLLSIDWPHSLSVAALATVLSLLTSVASSGIGSDGPSLVDAEHLSTPRHRAGA